MSTPCQVNNKLDEVTEIIAWHTDAIKYSEVSRIREDYQRIKDADKLMNRAFDTVWMKNFLDKNESYNWILVQLTNKSNAKKNHEYIEKMQTAFRSRVAEEENSSLHIWDKITYQNWRTTFDLSPTEIQFIDDLYVALNDFTKVWSDPNMHNQNRNLWIVIENAMSNVIVNQSLWDEDTPREWATLWQFIALTSPWQWKNNIFALLWILDADKNKNHASTVFDSNWEKENILISDLYSSNDEKMQRAVSLLFDIDTNKPAKWITYNPKIYRNSIKTMMKATEIDWLSRSMNTVLKLSAMWKLSSYTLWAFFGRLSWCMMWLTCFYTWYLNMMSYKKKNSNQKLHHALKLFWLWEDYFDFTDDPEDWLSKRLQYFWQALAQKDPRKWNVNDPTRSQNFVAKFTRNQLSKLSWMLMWVANIFWDTVFRWEYQLIAMDFALQKLWWDAWELEQHLYTIDNEWNMEMNIDAMYSLMSEYIKKLWDITWFPEIEWWWQSPFYIDIDWKTWAKKFLYSRINDVLRMWHWMTQRWTTYVNNTYKILAWWTVNAYYDIKDTFLWEWWEKTWDYKRKEYNWPGWRWLITKYTRQIDTDWVAMPWEAAQELVSKEEYAREVSRLLAWIRNMYRLWNMACRDEEWNLDIACAVKNFAEVAYLPWQAARIAHPIIRWLFNTIQSCYENFNYFWDRENLWVDWWDIIRESLLTNIIKPILRSMYPIKEFALAIDKWYDELNEDNFMERLYEVVMQSTDAMLYYTADELASYVYSSWAYWPKSYLNDDMTLFWTPNYLRDRMWRISEIKSVERLSRDWFWNRISDLFPTIRLIRWKIKDWDKYDSSSFYASDHAEEFISAINDDKDVQYMMWWWFTKEMKDNYDFMQYVWENLTSDRQSYWADFEAWIRNNQYNTSEIKYFEVLLQKEIAEATKQNPTASDLQIYDSALKSFFAWTPTYEQIKEAIQKYSDEWENWMWVYLDYLASAHRWLETTWVRWLALLAEYRKRQLMEESWLQYSSSASKEQKNQLKLIENQVASELWPYLMFADKRQYNNIIWRWFVEKHPEYKDYDPLKWLTDENWNWKIHGDVKTSWTLWTALRANTLARSELIRWNTNWYELANVFTEKFWSPYTEDWKFDPVKAAQIVDMVTFFDQALEDAEKTPMDRSMIRAPTFTKNLDMFTWVLSDESPEAKACREQLWDEVINNLRWLLYDTYNNYKSLPELLDLLNDKDVINTVLWKMGSWKSSYKWWNSLYYWNNTRKNYDYYSKPINAFKAWWASNLSKLVNSYGNWKSRYSWNYNSREFYFLNQRSYRNPVNSTRIAPDIPLTIWGFSKTTVKSKNPVSWFTTNIKPWEERSTAKFGKGKGIIWWSTTRWPVSSFKA